MPKHTWTLVDCRERARTSRGGFEVPSPEAVAALGPGALVKLVFLASEEPDARGCDGERMWVRIALASGGVFAGGLENQPVRIQGLRHGDAVYFETRHIAAIDGG